MLNRLQIVVLCLAAALLLPACDTGEEWQETAGGLESSVDYLQPKVEYLERNSLMVGETLYFYGQNFLSPEVGNTKLVFQGTYYVEDSSGNVVPEQVNNFAVTPIYDGEFPLGAELGSEQLAAGTTSLRWNRFGPYQVPFSSQGNKSGTFKGTVTAVNVYGDGTVETGEAVDVSLDVQPSIVIRKLEPVLGLEGGVLQSAECGSPALRAIGGIPYVLEVEAVGFVPEYFRYELTNINGQTEVTTVTHPAAGSVDRLGDPTWPTYLPQQDGMNVESIVFNALTEDDPYDRRISAITITAIAANGDAIYTALPLSIVRPLQFHYDGNRKMAERYEPVAVHGPVIGSLGTTLTYTESKSESRQNGVSVSVNTSISQSKGLSSNANWSEGVSQGQSTSTTNSIGVSHSEGESSSESYGVAYASSESNSASVSSSDGTTWNWNSSEGQNASNSLTETQDIYGELSGSTTVGANASGSIPGFAEVGGKVETTVGAKAGAKQGAAVGETVGTSTSVSESMGGSSNSSESFGSVTNESQSESLSGTFGLSSQSTVNNNTAETESSSSSVTLQMGGSQGITENVSVGSSETWSETWVNTSSDTKLLSYSSKVPNDTCAYVYRQTIRYVRKAQLYTYDLCGVRSVLGEAVFNEWSWSPNITIFNKSECETGQVPESSLPPAECFVACD